MTENTGWWLLFCWSEGSRAHLVPTQVAHVLKQGLDAPQLCGRNLDRNLEPFVELSNTKLSPFALSAL